MASTGPLRRQPASKRRGLWIRGPNADAGRLSGGLQLPVVAEGQAKDEDPGLHWWLLAQYQFTPGAYEASRVQLEAQLATFRRSGGTSPTRSGRSECFPLRDWSYVPLLISRCGILEQDALEDAGPLGVGAKEKPVQNVWPAQKLARVESVSHATDLDLSFVRLVLIFPSDHSADARGQREEEGRTHDELDGRHIRASMRDPLLAGITIGKTGGQEHRGAALADTGIRS